MITREERQRLSELARELVAAFVAGGRKRKAVPADQRAVVLEWLPKLLGSPSLLREYLLSLRYERLRQGVDELLLVMQVAELPVATIAANGFGELEDEVLGDLALCPDALETLQEQLYDNPELDAIKGDWFFAAQEVSARSLGLSRWSPPHHVTVIHQATVPTSRRWFWLTMLGLAVALITSGLALFLALRPQDAKPPATHRSPPESRNESVDTQPCIVSTPTGKLGVQIVAHEMLRTSHPISPYRLTISASEPVYLMHVFGWRNPSGWLWFGWHGPNFEKTLPSGMSEVIYPDDREKRKFQGFAGYLLVFTSVPVPDHFWKVLDTIPKEKSYAGRIDPTREFLLEELGKIGIPPEKVFIFAAVESTIDKE